MPPVLAFFQIQSTPILKSPPTVFPSDLACLHPTSILKTRSLESPLCKSHTLLVFLREATSTLEHRRHMYYPSVMFKAPTSARLGSRWKWELQVVSLLMLLLWYNPVWVFFKHSFVSQGSHQGKHDLGGAVALGTFCIVLVAEQRAHVSTVPMWSLLV